MGGSGNMQPRATGNKKSGETPGGTLIAGVRTEEGRGGVGRRGSSSPEYRG